MVEAPGGGERSHVWDRMKGPELPLGPVLWLAVQRGAGAGPGSDGEVLRTVLLQPGLASVSPGPEPQ